jgi:POT family proton-dependent oligopeptide transporter
MAHLLGLSSQSVCSRCNPLAYLLKQTPIVVMGIGAGFIKANVSPLIGEQYQGKMRKETLPSGEVVIRSPAVTIQSIYMCKPRTLCISILFSDLLSIGFYAAINFGSVGAISASFLARDNGYWAAFLVPTCIFALVPIIMAFGKKYYVLTPPRGSVLLDVSDIQDDARFHTYQCTVHPCNQDGS